MTQFDREYQEGLDPNKNYYPQTQPQQFPPGMVNQGFDPQMQQQQQQQPHGDINPPYGYNNQQQYPQQQQFLQQPYPNGNNNQFQSLPPNMHMVGPGNQSGTPSPYGFANVNLVGAGPGSNSSQTQVFCEIFLAVKTL